MRVHSSLTILNWTSPRRLVSDVVKETHSEALTYTEAWNPELVLREFDDDDPDLEEFTSPDGSSSVLGTMLCECICSGARVFVCLCVHG